ncbi:hypothetical protein LK533_03375 [Sphingomonas sp. PL-96]|uniref:hypothetical protein n=1 Tax=Sphingomonas sp. PL-96 TaxID=2887201 RepID=UPI001E53CFD8|nr:hypothetical protein [Sphingomonas sp. PL-96]MCC2975716.1 hypothetical protein [Sphingomonas sp. PL-96]
MSTKYIATEAQLIDQLFGLLNFRTGGVGRIDRARFDASSNESRLAIAAAERDAHVLVLGTDYVVVKAGTELRKVYQHPKPAEPHTSSE